MIDDEEKSALRDFFAGQALAGVFAAPAGKFVGANGEILKTADDAAKIAYITADAMLAERMKGVSQ